jgi:hypothetical protein
MKCQMPFRILTTTKTVADKILYPKREIRHYCSTRVVRRRRLRPRRATFTLVLEQCLYPTSDINNY